MYRLPRGWKWSKDRWPNVVRLATNGTTEVWLSHDGDLVIGAPSGEIKEAPASVVLAVMALSPTSEPTAPLNSTYGGRSSIDLARSKACKPSSPNFPVV